MKYVFLSVVIFFLFNTAVFPQENKSTPIWQADWQQLRTRPYPQWFKDAKLGVFIHWGVSSVPAYGGKESYNEWFLRGLQTGDTLRTNFQKRVYGEDFTYRDYAPLFKAELFNAAEWADLFKRSGARYIIFVAKHHDGYCLWPSRYAPGWNSSDVGPEKDIVGELSKAVRAAGLRMGLYYSLTEWNHPLHRWYADPPENIGPYVEQHMIPQFKELIGTYKPSLVFADGEWFNKADDFRAAELLAWYFNLVGEEAIVNERWGAGSDVGYRTPEYSSGLQMSERPWAEVRGLGRSFGLNRNEKIEAYMKADELIHFFVKAVSHGGGITINVGPQADGQIPLLQQERLLELGQWLAVNGEAIYGSTMWQRAGEEKEVVLERTDPQIDFNWVRNTPGKPVKEDHFTATWTGFIEPAYAEEYLFEALADDGIRMWIDGRLIINNWKKEEEGADGNVMTADTGRKEAGKIQLIAGKKYPIRVEYFENLQNASVRLFWSSQNQAKQIVPQSSLYLADASDTGNGLTGIYRSMQQYICYTKNHGNLYATVLEWPGKELILPVALDSSTAKISMLGRPGNFKFKVKNKKTMIDLNDIYFNHLPGLYAWTFKIESPDI